jgi:hypothetical protein
MSGLVLFRTVDRIVPPTREFFGDVGAADFARRLTERFGRFHCHWGQRKLLYALMEFLVAAARRFDSDLSDFLVVYAGAAPGYSTGLVAAMLPWVEFRLVDPARFDLPHPPAKNVRATNALFSDASARELRKKTQKKVLFVSDIRMRVNEADIRADMDAQARWADLIGSVGTMLKFRPPFFDAKIKDSTDYQYLDGELLVQLHAPPRSMETRLVAFRASSQVAYKTKKYDCFDYDVRMHHFNSILRLSKYSRPNLAPLVRRSGAAPRYEEACEYHIARSFVRAFGGGPAPLRASDGAPVEDDPDGAVRLVGVLGAALEKKYGTDVDRCARSTLTRFLRKNESSHARG